MYESNSSLVAVLQFDESARLETISDLHVSSHSANSISLAWSPINHAQKYHILPKALSSTLDDSELPAEYKLLVYPSLPPIETTTAGYTGEFNLCCFYKSYPNLS